MKLYGLLGRTLKHSFSQKYFTNKFHQEKIDAHYRNFELESIQDILSIIRKEPSLCGFNITIPYKETIIPLLSGISEDARIIGAVNCVKINRQEERISLYGYNTDHIGFRRALLEFLYGVIPTQAYILGTGGASKAVAYVLHSIHIPVSVVSRTPQSGQINYTQLNEQLSSISFHTPILIVNCTPLGTWPACNTAPSIPYEKMNNSFYLFDLVYNPQQTQFMKNGEQYGAHTTNGLHMLIAQAEEGWKIWNS